MSGHVGYKHGAPIGAFPKGRGSRPRDRTKYPGWRSAPYRRGHNLETVAHRPAWRDDGRSQPRAFARRLALEPLENAAQPRALDGGHDGQPVALVIRASLGANLRPRDRAFCGRGVSRIQRRCAQTGRAANSQRHGARQPSLKQVEFGFHDYVLCCVDISPQTPPRKYGFITPTAWTCSSCPCQYFNGSLAILLSYGWPNGLVVTVRY